MAIATYDKIATQTLASAAATITFSSIASSWTDLKLVFTATTSSGSNQPSINFNSDSATNYSLTSLKGSGSAASSIQNTSLNTLYLENSPLLSTTIPTLFIVDIFSYAGSTYKTVLIQTSSDFNGSGYVERHVGTWRSTAAITQIVIKSIGALTFAAGATATLYGIKAA